VLSLKAMNFFSWWRHLFVPHSTNNYKAKLLHPSVLSVIVAFFLVYQFGINFLLLVQPAVLGFASNITPERILELTNQERAKRGLQPLRLNQTLNQAAQLKAGDMFAFNYWSHTSPSGRDPWSFFKEAGYRYLYAGENLARDFMNSEAVVRAWMNSPAHRENILNGRYQEIGLAVVDGTLNGVETTLVVQLFGTPLPAATAKKKPLIGQAIATVSAGTVAPATVFARATGQEREQLPLLSPFTLTKTITVFLLGVLLGVLLLDLFLVSRRKLVRLSGRTLAHAAFIGILLLLAFLTQQGAIL